MKTFGVIGMGNMAEAIVGGALKKGVLSPDQVKACEKDEARSKLMNERLSLPCTATLKEAATCDIVMLAVKPQHTKEVLSQLKEYITDNTALLSIVAGVTCASMDQYLGGKGRIIRTMPNTPLIVGRGVTAISQGPRATDSDLAWAQQFFHSLGLSVIVPEAQIDTIAAISGSGPAYFFYIVEALAEAGISSGLDPDLSLKLSLETAAGAALLLTQSNEGPETLRRNVTSPGGSTAEAIAVFDQEKLKETFVKAVAAAIKRNGELGL